MDALSTALRLAHLTDAEFIGGRFTAPWCYRSPLAVSVNQPRAIDSDRLVVLRMLTEGECYIQMDGQSPLHLTAGDAVIFPHGDEHCVSSHPGLPSKCGTSLEDAIANSLSVHPPEGGQTVSSLICGHLACDARLARTLLAGMPRIVRVNVRGCEAGAWLEAALRFSLTAARSPRPGSAGVMAKLAEALFAEVLRIYMSEQPGGDGAWLAGLGDRIVGVALNAMHSDPRRAWTLEELAQKAGASRSVLAERFQQLVGTSPIQYLTQWRMSIAANLLSRSSESLAKIAKEVGYQTDTAFSRAFRRTYDAPPAAWRKAKRNQNAVSLFATQSNSNEFRRRLEDRGAGFGDTTLYAID